MRIRAFGLIAAVLASVSAQAADAAPLRITPGHVDPLLSLSLLASEHSHTIACARGESCASQVGDDEGVDARAMRYGELAPAQSNWLALLSPALFAAGWYVFMTEMTKHNIHHHKHVSPD